MSLNLTLSSNDRSNVNDKTHDFKVKFEPPINLSTPREGYIWTMGLKSMKCWYSFYNIDASAYSNATFIWNATTYTITDGVYNIFQLQSAVDALIGAGNVTLQILESQLKIAIIVNSGTLDLSVGDLYKLFGFSPAQAATPMVAVSTTIGDNVADVTNGIDNLYVNCDLATGTWTGKFAGSVIFEFVPNKLPGRNLEYNPINIVYLPIKLQTGYIREMRFWITDNLGRKVNFNGEDFVYTIHLKQVRIA